MPNIDDIYKSKYTGEEIDALLDKVQLQDFNYDSLKDKPIINQDLLIGGFTPQENTYYRHTGTTANGFANGIIYLYSGGKYTSIKGGGGKDGTTFTPSVSENGIISWTNDGGKENPAPVNIKGPKGDSGVASGTVNSNTEGTSDTDGYTQQAVNKIASRPNLLINPDFSINQRGQKSYSGGKYGVDRWLFSTGTTAEIQESGALKLKRTAAGNCCLQRIEDWKKLVGKTVTLSVKFSQITEGRVACSIYTGTTFMGTTVSTSGSVSTVTVTISKDATKVECFIFASSACEVVPEYAKLEIGSVATEFIPPLIAEELPKCQRYYLKLQASSTYTKFGYGDITGTSGGDIQLNIPRTLRTTPTIIVSSGLNLYERPTAIYSPVTSAVVRSITAAAVIIRLTTSGTAFTTNNLCVLQSSSTDASIQLDAEIY